MFLRHWLCRWPRPTATTTHAHLPATAMTDESDIYWTFRTASAFGGAFYGLLADAGFAADYSNKLRLIKAFPAFQTNYGPKTRLHAETRHGKTS